MTLIQTALRGLQLLWIVLLTALIGNVIATAHNNHLVSNAAVNFSMFVIVLSWLAALYGLVGSIVMSLAIPIVMLAADGLAVLFTFIDAIVLAALLRARNCGSDHNMEKKCRELQASTAFMWFLLATFVGSLVLAGMAFRRGGGGGSVRSAGPSMKQVHVTGV
ncbi:hypothetical protein N0V82_007341 [Gnomoniopsis sp. IMI 355080]|nr:hypothetical protein N0V82_007341 [Gnomoniopsis sp. IMI 355080]